jgi:antiviral helicase SLH1
MSRIDLPISDYVGDQTSVLDQGIRIIQASVDVMAELGYLPACRHLIALLQCIKSARWPDDSALSILPGIDTTDVPSALPDSLATLSSLQPPAISNLTKKLHLPHHQFAKAAATLPNLSISIPASSPAGMTVFLNRRNPPQDPECRIYAPRFPKPQTEGFFLLVCATGPDGRDADLLALKRVAWPPPASRVNRNASGSSARSQRSPLSVKSTVKFPAALRDLVAASGSAQGSGLKVNVVVVSDSYPGMEWRIGGVDVDVGGGGLGSEKGNGSGKGKKMQTQVLSGSEPPVKG